MPEDKMHPEDSISLRQRALERLKNIPRHVPVEPEEAIRLVEELRISQCESEIQNEDLRATQQQLIESREALRQSEKQYRNLFNTMEQGVIYQDANGIIISANPAAERILGIPLDQLLGRSSLDFPRQTIYEDGSPCHGKDHFAMMALRTGHKTSGVLGVRIHSLDIEIRWLEITATPEFAENQSKPNQVYSIFTDITKRKRDEKSLLDNEERFRKIFEEAPLGIVISAPDFTFEKANPAFCRMIEYSIEELQSMTFADITHPDHIKQDLENIQKVRRGEMQSYHTVKRYMKKNGGVLWGELLASTIRDERGSLRYYLSMVNDITERKRADEALIESELRLHYLTDNLPNAIVYQITAEPNGGRRFIYVSRGVERLNEITVESVLADAGILYKQMLPEYFAHVKKLEENAIQNLTGLRVEVQSRLPSGRLRWFEYSSTPRHLPSGITVWDGVEIDITDRKKTEEALRKSEQQLKKAQEIAHLGSWELDVLTNELLWSDEVYRIFGLSKEFKVSYESFLDRVHPDDRAIVDKAYMSSLREGKNSYEIEHRIVRKSTGEVRIVQERCEHIRDESGTIIRSVGMVHDITDLALARKRSEEIMAQLMVANRELESFSFSVSHDLAAPIRRVKEFCSILMEDYQKDLNSVAQDYLKRIIKGADKMQDLIQDLLNLSRISRLEINKQHIDLSSLAEEVIDELRQSQPQRNVEVIIQPNLFANCDAHLMQIALTNLIGNAWKYTSKIDNPRVQVGASVHDNKTVFFIRDNGAGFKQEYAERIFLPFQRMHSEHEFSGSGIGLAIVKRIIEKHGGSIWANSEPGKGTTLYFILPD